MVTENESDEIARSVLDNKEKESGITLKISERKITGVGIIYFYNSREYVDAGNFSEMLLGNSPFIVDADDGAVHFFGTSFSADRYLDEYIKYRSEYDRRRTF